MRCFLDGKLACGVECSGSFILFFLHSRKSLVLISFYIFHTLSLAAKKKKSFYALCHSFVRYCDYYYYYCYYYYVDCKKEASREENKENSGKIGKIEAFVYNFIYADIKIKFRT